MYIRAGSEPEPEPLVDINTTPLVDVLLVLLVMLIVTIPIQLHAVGLDMPSPSTPPPPVAPVVVQLDVNAVGQYVWNGEVLANRGVLEERLRAAATDTTQPEIHVHPDPHAKYEAVAAALSSAQRLGLQKIGLVGESPEARRQGSYSGAPWTQMNDCRSIMSRALKPGLRSRSRRLTAAKVSRSWSSVHAGLDS